MPRFPSQLPYITALLLLLMPLGHTQAPADAAVKAKLSMAVARFAELPDAPAAGTLRFCVVSRTDVLLRAFAGLSGQRIGGRSVEIVVIDPVDCDVLFISEGVPEWRSVVRAAGGRALTIGDMAGFMGGGGMIELVLENDAMRFDVNLEAVRQHRIRQPGQVLKLARRVRE
jgi:hypothetical protein